jgi:hypothetical protein
VSDRVDADVDAMKVPLRDAPCDRGIVEAARRELTHVNAPVLARRHLRHAGIGWSGARSSPTEAPRAASPLLMAHVDHEGSVPGDL